jgi:hypothetical protein
VVDVENETKQERLTALCVDGSARCAVLCFRLPVQLKNRGLRSRKDSGDQMDYHQNARLTAKSRAVRQESSGSGTRHAH